MDNKVILAYVISVMQNIALYALIGFLCLKFESLWPMLGLVCTHNVKIRSNGENDKEEAQHD